MEMYIPKSFRQIIAMILCLAMMMPMIAVPGNATELTEPAGDAVVVSAEAPAEVPTEAPTKEAAVESADVPEDTENAKTVNAAAVITIADGISIPAYSGGTTSKTLEYDCGNGVTGRGEKSYLTIVTGTTSAQFLAYTKLLADNDYVLKDDEVVEITSDDPNDPNRFASFTSPDGKFKLYTYHFPFYGETRIIVDTQADTVEGFNYTPQSGTEVKPILTMYGLSMATNGYDGQYSGSQYTEQRRNCGALVVIRMPDNSLFIHDGGDVQQWSDNACEEFLAFCRELTGTTGTNEKMVINTWFLSHAHSDHFLGFPRFINKCHDHFELKNIIYNIDSQRTGSTRDIEDIMNLVSGCFDGVNYYKPHTGESFEIAGVKFEVIYALEDRFLPTEDGELIIDTDDKGGTYRGYSYDEANVMTSASDFNDTCTVLRVTFPNEVKSILYADMNRAENTLFDIYPEDALKGHIVMVPHHGFDEHAELMAMSDATIFLYTQHKQAIYGLDDDYTTEEDASVVRARLRNNFLPLMEALNDKPNYVEGKDYKFYWAGCETAVIDINSMSGADTETEDFGMTPDTEAANMGITVYTSEANNDLYTNAWTVYDLNDGTATVGTFTGNQLGISGSATVTNKSTETTKQIRFNTVTELGVNSRYLIRSAAYPQFVMSYSAVAQEAGTPNTPTSLVANSAPGDSTATNLFFEKDGYIYLDHSNRDNGLWILKQDGTANNAVLTVSNTHEPLFGGTIYDTIRLYKGVGAYDENGATVTGHNGVYWYSIKGNDGGSTQYRFLNPRYVSNLAWLRNVAISQEEGTAVDLNQYVIESFSDDTFLIYYRNAKGTDVRILTCDADGNWAISRYTNSTSDSYPAVSEAKANLDKLKVKLYAYDALSAIKAVQFSGPDTFHVKQGATEAQVVNYIQQEIVVRDQARRNLAIPGSGGTPKVGYYWVKCNETFDSSAAGTFTFTVYYRNDDGTDTTIIDTLKVNVAGIKVSGNTTYTVMEGTGKADVEALIEAGIDVTMTAGGTKLKDLTYTSTPAEGDYYWLDFNIPFDSGASGTKMYTVSVKYRNPNDTDAVSNTTLTVIVKPLVFEFDGATTYVVEEGVTETDVRKMINDSITVTEKTLGEISYAATPTVGSYWLEFDSVFGSGADGDHDYFVKAYYRNADGTDTLVETVAVYVEQKITEWTQPIGMVGTVPLNAGLTTVVQHVEGETASNITFTVNGEERFVTVGLLTDANGKRVNTTKAGTYTGLTLTYMDQVICTGFTLIVAESSDVLDYPQKGQDGYVGVNKQTTTTTVEFKETGVADIRLSATGTPPEQGIDLIVIMDLSGSMLNEMGTNVDALDYQNSRAVAMEKALKDMVQMLAESKADVTIAMSDFGDVDHYVFDGAAVDESIIHESVIDINNDNGRYLSSSNDNKDFEFTNHLNYVFRSGEATALDANGRAAGMIGTFANVHTKFNQAHPQYTGVIVPNVYTGTGEVEAGAFVKVSELYDGGFTSAMNDIIAEIDENVHKALGTNYDIGLEYAYQLAYAKQQENIANDKGEERDIVCIFMSDGAAMQFNYFAGRPDSQAWSDYLLSRFDSIGSTGFTAENAAEKLNKISERMLEALQKGNLSRWEYHRDAPSPALYVNVGDAKPFDNSYDEGEHFIYRMRSDKGRNPSTSSFYSYMEDLSFDLDWEYLCAIAKANGIEDFDLEYYQNNPRLPELIDKLLNKDTLLGYEKVETKDDDGNVTATTWYEVYQTDLVNPGLDETRYYPKFTGAPPATPLPSSS